MIKLLGEMLLFFRKERLYFLLLVLVLLFYALIYSIPRSKSGHSREEASAKTAESFKAAEDEFGQKMSEEGFYEDFVRKNPLLASVFQGLTLFFILGFLAGFVLDILLLLKPSWRQKFTSGAPPPQTRPWPFSMLFKVVILFIVWGFLISVLLGVLHTAFPKFVSGNFSMVAHTLLLDLLGIFFMIRFLKREGSHWRELGFRVPDGKIAREVGAGLLGYIGILPLFMLMLAVLIFISSITAVEPAPHPLVNVFLEEEKRQPALVFFSVMLGIVVGPVFEEIFFRGFCYPILKNRIGKFWAMAGSSLFFAGIHHSGFAFWPVFILGMGLAYVYETRKSLLSPVVMHVFHNALFIGYFFIVKQVIGWHPA